MSNTHQKTRDVRHIGMGRNARHRVRTNQAAVSQRRDYPHHP